MATRLTPEQYHKLLGERGYTLLSELATKSSIQMHLLCPNGHECFQSYNNLQTGQGCKKCANIALSLHKRIKPEAYHALAASKGYVIISDVPNYNNIKMTLRCSHGHEFQSTYDNLRVHGCVYCAREKNDALKRHTVDNYHALAASKKWLWLGNELPKNTEVPTLWECPMGHRVLKSYDLVRYDGCRECYSLNRSEINRRHTKDDYINIALAHGFTWTGEELPNSTNTKTFFQCEKGHIFAARLDTIKRGQGCPKCQDRVNGVPVSKPQRAIHALVGGELNYPARRYRIDIALEPLSLFRIGIEYDCIHWHRDNEEHDTKRTNWLLEHGWKILRIKSRYAIPDIETLQTAIGRLRDGERYIEIVLGDWGS